MSREFCTSFILPNGFALGGVTSWSLAMSQLLARSGRRTAVIRHVDGCAGQKAKQPAGVDLIECPHPIHPNNWYLFRKDIAAYRDSYRRVLPAVMVPNYSFGAYAACALLAAENPEKLRVLGMVHTDNDEYYGWIVRFEQIIHTFIAVSREIADRIAALLPHRRQDILHRPCAVAACDIAPRTYTSSPLPLQLLYAGRLTERQKRVSDLVRLAADLQQAGVAFELNVYGDGRDRPYLEKLIESQDGEVRSRIHLAGHVAQEELTRSYRLADISILVSEYEGTSLSMLESMTQGCVPIVTRVSGVAEVIADGENGCIVPTGDIRGMAERIAHLDGHRSHLQQLGRSAQATVRDRYGYDRYVSWFSDVLDEMWAQPPRPWKDGTSFLLHFPLRQFVKEAGYTLAARPGLSWLHRLRDPLRKFVG